MSPNSFPFPKRTCPHRCCRNSSNAAKRPLQKKQTVDASDFDARLNSQSHAKEENAVEDEQRYEMEAEAYQAEMRDIYEREDILLKELDAEEQQDQKQLAELTAAR